MGGPASASIRDLAAARGEQRPDALNTGRRQFTVGGAHAYSIMGWLQADIRRRELVPTEGADTPARPPTADFSPREETWHDDALVRNGLRTLPGGARVLETRPISLLVGRSFACSGQVDAEATVEDDFER